jgi:hypothetical protein
LSIFERRLEYDSDSAAAVVAIAKNCSSWNRHFAGSHITNCIGS